MKSLLIILTTIIVFRSISGFENQEMDLIPNEETAIKVAEAIWYPIYGDRIYSNKPFRAHLEDSIWIVEGTLPKGMRGGTPYIEIRRRDCKILKVTHGR